MVSERHTDDGIDGQGGAARHGRMGPQAGIPIVRSVRTDRWTDDGHPRDARVPPA